MKALFVEVRKAKSGKTYVALVGDLGYNQIVITFDRGVISDLLGYTPEQFFEFTSSPVGTKILIKFSEVK